MNFNELRHCDIANCNILKNGTNRQPIDTHLRNIVFRLLFNNLEKSGINQKVTYPFGVHFEESSITIFSKTIFRVQ